MEKIRDSIKLRSKVKARLLQQALFRGSLLGGIGGVLLLGTGAFLAPHLLRWWGPASFALGITLVTAGLLPYRKLNKLRGNPYELLITTDEITLKRSGKSFFAIPNASIESVSYLEVHSAYGIALRLKKPLPQKFKVISQNLDMEKWQDSNQKRYGHPIVLPFFTQDATEELKDCLEAQLHDVVHLD